MNLKRYLPYCAVTLLAILGSGGICAAQDAAGPTPFPAKDSAEWPGKGVIRVFPWMVDNRNYFWSKRAESQDAVVFIGDSLTGNWGNMAKAFPKMKVINHGIGGDVSRGVLFRFQEDVLDLHPKAVVILIGQNDLTAKGNPSDTISNIDAVLAMTAKQTPPVPVILCTVPPSASPQAPVDPEIRKVLNEGIVGLAKGKANVTLLDLWPLVALPDGAPDPQYFKKDLLHFDNPGYAKWTEALNPIFEKLKLQ